MSKFTLCAPWYREIGASYILSPAIAAVKQLLKSMWKSFKQHFQDLENSLYDQKEQIDYHIKIASESEAHKERQLASLYRRQGAEHRLLEIEQWAEAREWRVEHSKFAQSRLSQMHTLHPRCSLIDS